MNILNQRRNYLQQRGMGPGPEGGGGAGAASEASGKPPFGDYDRQEAKRQQQQAAQHHAENQAQLTQGNKLQSQLEDVRNKGKAQRLQQHLGTLNNMTREQLQNSNPELYNQLYRSQTG